MGRRAGPLPRVDRRDRRRRGQQADRAVQPREGALQAQVLPGRVLDLQRDRRQAEPPQIQRDAPLAGEARDRPAGAGRHRRARRQVQRGAGRASSTTRSSRTSTGSSTTCSAATSTGTGSTRRRSASSRRSTARASSTSRRSSSAASRTSSSARASRRSRRSSASSGPSKRATSRSRTRRACATSRTCRWRARSTRRASSSTRPDQRADGRPDAPLGGGEVLEQGRHQQRVLARRALRGVVGVLHGGRLQPRARQHPHDRVAVLPARELPRGRRPQGGHLLRELPVRRRADHRREVPRALRADPRRADEAARRVQEGVEPGGRVLQVPEGRARRQGAHRPEDRRPS